MTDHDSMDVPAAAVASAEHLLQFSAGTAERNVEREIANLLEGFGIRVVLDYQTDAGRADICCPEHRFIIEVKAPGRATTPHQSQGRQGGETAFAQLERYVLAEINRQLGSLNFNGSRRWIGIVTDGRVWHAWSWEHAEGAHARTLREDWEPTTGIDLCSWISALRNEKVKQAIPVNPLTVLEPRHRDLQKLYAGRDQDQPLATKKALWLDLMRAALMAPGENAIDRLFVAHSFLVAVARGVIATLIRPDAPSIDGREALREGFVGWITEDYQGQQWAQGLFQHIHRYEWRRRRGDVLRPFYESLVGESDRKVFGEYYTPDWLAELIVREALDEEWCVNSVEAALLARRSGDRLERVGVLDPACGSGTFLYHAVRRILASKALEGQSPVQQATVAAMLVNGIDIHPIAAEMARATLLRALPAPPEGGAVSVRIYQGDALMAGESDRILMEEGFGYTLIVTPGEKELSIPRPFITSPSFLDDLGVIVERAGRGEAGCPAYVLASVGNPDAQEDMRRFCRDLRDVIRKEGNSVWAWYIANITGPMLLSHRRVNRVVSNPPWVTMREIQTDERKRSLEYLAEHKLKIWTGGKQAPHFDIASLFIKRVREKYLSDERNDVGAWLVKKAALRAGSWKKFRNWHQKHLSQQLDLELLQPFGGGDARRCCVLLEKRRFRNLTSSEAPTLVAKRSGNLPRPLPEQRLSRAQQLFRIAEAAAPVRQAPSAYVDGRGKPVFRNGATIVPHVLAILGRVSSEGAGTAEVTTVASKKGRWRDVRPESGSVPSKWISGVVLSKHLLPYATLAPSKALIPTDNAGVLLENPGRECEFWDRLEAIWRDNRGKGRAAPRTLLGNLDYQGKLSAQLPLWQGGEMRTVLHPKSSDIMRASRAGSGGAVIDHTLYRWNAASDDEAAFLVAMLNAPCLEVAFKQCRNSGRDFHSHPWRKVPLPRYDGADQAHRRLAVLCEQAEEESRGVLEAAPVGMGQVGLSRRIRTRLDECGINDAIDELVTKIMPIGVARPPDGDRPV